MKKKLNGFLKNKKGFSLVECIVALLLFSIITGSVITVFISSRNQIKKQNDNHKLDILASNILSAYEASESFEDFKRILNSDLKIDIGNPGSQQETVPLGKGSGAGSIPIALPYQKILVNNGTASFLDTNGSAILSFNGRYNRNKLSEGDNKDIPSEKYDKKNVSEMVIAGGIRQKLSSNPNNYKYTVYKDEINNTKYVKFQIQNKASAFIRGMLGDTESDASWKTYTAELSDFDEYLLDNGYYLKCISSNTHKEPESYRHRVYNGKFDFIGHWEDCGKDDPGAEVKSYKTLYDYYFQVYDASKTGEDSDSATPVKNSSNQYLYYCVSFDASYHGYLGDGKNIGSKEKTIYNYYCDQAIDNAAAGNGDKEKMKFELSHASITYAYGSSCPNNSGFDKKLENNGSEFKGNWYFIPWIFYRSIDNSNNHFKDARNSMFSFIFKTHNEYFPKSNDYKSIYYALANGDNIDLINTNGDRMFSFNASGKTNPLKDANCILKDIESTKKYKDADWDLYYKKGSMLQQQISHIEFNNKVATVYDSNGAAFIRFIYKNNKFDSDKNSVLSGDYKKYYNISGNTATVKDEYKGDIFFSCIKFDGEYSITTKSEDNDPIFVSNADNFEIIGAVENSDLSYGVIGQPYAGEVDSQTYYITCGLENVKRKLIVKVTFTNLAKVKQNDAAVFIEPRIYIWSVDGAKIVNNSLEGLQQLSTTTNVKLEYSYRKG